MSVCEAAARSWTAYDGWIEKTKEILDKSDFVEQDVAWCMDMAGEICLRHRKRERARKAFEIAKAGWQRLGNSSRYEAAKGQVEALSGMA
jgi:hypothetical protein